MRLNLFSPVVAAALVIGCGQPTETASLTTPPLTPASARVDQVTRARYTYADSLDLGTVGAPLWVRAGIRGDGRLRDGAAALADVGPTNEYQGNFCGVSAVIGSGVGGQSSDLNFDPNMQWSSTLPASCQPARGVLVYMNGATMPPSLSRPHQIVANIATLAIGQSWIQPMDGGTFGDLGVGLRFNAAYPPASDIMVTRLPNIIDEFGRSVRQWTVGTQGSHRAMGFVSGRKGLVSSGITYYLPFAMTVTEVPYPFPTYP